MFVGNNYTALIVTRAIERKLDMSKKLPDTSKDELIIHNERVKALADVSKTLSAGSFLTCFVTPVVARTIAGLAISDFTFYSSWVLGTALLFLFWLLNWFLLGKILKSDEKKSTGPTIIVNGIHATSCTVENPGQVKIVR